MYRCTGKYRVTHKECHFNNDHKLQMYILFSALHGVVNRFEYLRKLPRYQNCIMFKFAFIKLCNIVIPKNWKIYTKTIVRTRSFLHRFSHISSVRVKICQNVKKIILKTFFCAMPNLDPEKNICKKRPKQTECTSL